MKLINIRFEYHLVKRRFFRGSLFGFINTCIIIVLLVLCCPSDIIAQNPVFKNKIEKILHKTFKHQNVSIKELTEGSRSDYPNRTFYYIIEQNDSIGILVINKSFGCHLEGCDNPTEQNFDLSNSAYEEFYYAIIFNLDLTIKYVKILEYDSEYGYEICSKRWLKQFRQKKAQDIKLNQNIDGISGATVSVNSIINDVANLGFLLEN